ncbi:DUF2752 domain-containing protein [Chryseobacterium sp. NEB161]|nr:DUF2752 domain-containing protein [Chryseobacterium sp. NEB161]
MRVYLNNLFNKKNVGYIIVVAFVVVIIAVYYFLNPSDSSLFLSCPLKSVTGYDCPGCGSQRALHALLHGRFAEAFGFNPLFVISIPLVLLILLISWINQYRSADKQILFYRSKAFLIIVLIIVLLFSLFRNTDCYHGIFEN